MLESRLTNVTHSPVSYTIWQNKTTVEDLIIRTVNFSKDFYQVYVQRLFKGTRFNSCVLHSRRPCDFIHNDIKSQPAGQFKTHAWLMKLHDCSPSSIQILSTGLSSRSQQISFSGLMTAGKNELNTKIK